MRGQTLFATALMACVVPMGVGGIAPAVDAATISRPSLKFGESATSDVIVVKRRVRRLRSYPPPIAPSYLAYDYPYYYARGFYPTHIGPGYIYYGVPYLYRSGYYRRYGGRCSIRHRRCVAKGF
ncbi:MAG: hypothetical protein ACT4OU_09015 [Hyphomicrobium sp.]